MAKKKEIEEIDELDELDEEPIDEEPIDESEEIEEEIKPKNKKDSKNKPLFYKGYDIKWLKEETQHPDYGLIAEYEKKYGKIN